MRNLAVYPLTPKERKQFDIQREAVARGAIPATGGFGYRFNHKIKGFKKGGTHNPKGMTKALNRATVKKTGMRVVKKNELVIPKTLAKQLKKVARRKPK